MDDFYFILKDRCGIIRDIVNKFGEDRFYISYSGGKDSTCLSALVDLALPTNNIPRVYVDTGIEYLDVKAFVKSRCLYDPRFLIIPPSKSIRFVLDHYGYPFKSKEHSHILSVYQHSGIGKSVKNYLGEGSYIMNVCPKCLKYQFSPTFPLKVSDLCCSNLKKKPFHDYSMRTGRNIAMTGIRKDEGGQRASVAGCVIKDKSGNVVKFHPLLVVSDAFIDEFIKRYDVQLCKLYYPPFNFKRTGCKGCPYSLDLQEQLSIMDKYLPHERMQCELIWGKVYAEYRRIGFRLDKAEQLKLF